MATPAFAQIQVSINSGANQSGGVVASFGQSVALTAVNTTGWFAALWQIYDYPPGFSAPAGWSTDASGVIYFQPSNPTTPPPSFNLPASGSSNWGKFALRLRINNNPLQRNLNGSPNQTFTPQYTDETTVIEIPSPSLGMPGVCFNETTQYDTLRQAVGQLMVCLRKLDVTFGGGGTVSVSGTGILHATGSVLDAAAYRGTAGQFLITNAGATDTGWVSLSGDVSASTGTPGQLTVAGIQTHAVPAPTGTNTALLWSGSALSWGNASINVANSGLVHVTSSSVDANAYRGTAGQILFTNSGASDTTWATSTQDVSYSTTTIGLATVTGIRGSAVPVPSGTNTVLTWSGSALSWTNLGVSVTGFGVVHVTSGSIDAAASKGTAGQFLLTNSGATDTAWTTLSGDVSASTSTVGQITVTGLQTKALPAPSGTGTVLTWNAGSSGALSWATVSGSGVTWASDLLASTNSNQWVQSISGNAGAGGTVALNITTLQWANGQTNPTINQASTAGATGQTLTIASQASTNTNGTPGNILLSIPAKTGSGVPGFVQIQNAGNILAAIGDTTPSYNDFGTIWLSTPAASPNNGSYSIQCDSNNTTVNAPNAGFNVKLAMNGATNYLFNSSGAQLFGSSTTFGGGTGVLGITAVTGLPTSAPSGALIAYANSGSPGTLGLFSPGIAFHRLAGAVSITQDNPTTDVATTGMTIGAQNALASASTNRTGGSLILQGGGGATTNGTPGDVFLTVGTPTGTGTQANVKIQAAGAVTYIFNANGAQFFASTTSFGGGVGVLGFAQATNIPGAAPSGTNSIAMWAYPSANTQFPGALGIFSTGIAFHRLTTNPTIAIDTCTTDVTPTSLLVAGQTADPGASTNVNGGSTTIWGGGAKSNGTTGLRGSVLLALPTFNNTLVEVCEPVINQRQVALCGGTVANTTKMPSGTGDLVVYIGNCLTAPSASPTSGGILYEVNGAGFRHYSTDAVVTTMGMVGTGTQNTQANFFDRLPCRLRTATTSATTFLTQAMPASTTIMFMIMGQGRDTSGGTVGGSFAIFLVSRNSGSTVTVQGGTVGSNLIEFGLDPTISATASGTNVLLQITPTNNTTTDWTFDVWRDFN